MEETLQLGRILLIFADCFGTVADVRLSMKALFFLSHQGGHREIATDAL